MHKFCEVKCPHSSPNTTVLQIENYLEEYDKRAAQRNDVTMAGQFVPKREQVRVKVASTTEEKLGFMFKLYDQDQSGTLDRNEIRQLLSALNTTGGGMVQNIDEMVTQFMQHVDQNGDGVIDVREFRRIANDPALAQLRDQILVLLTRQFQGVDDGLVQEVNATVQADPYGNPAGFGVGFGNNG